jgi:hypothetical protein
MPRASQQLEREACVDLQGHIAGEGQGRAKQEASEGEQKRMKASEGD